MSTSTVWMPETTSVALPSNTTTWEITTWKGRFIGQTNDPLYAEQMGRSGYLVKEA